MPSTSRIKEEKISNGFPVCMTTEELRESLQYFVSTTESCIGPQASLKMVISGTGSLVTTSSSHRLWSLIQVEHIMAEFILQSVKSLPDHRLFASSLAARMLMEDKEEDIEMDRLSEAIDDCAMEMDLSNLSQLINLVKSIIRPKAKCGGLLDLEIDNLGVQIVKAWLRTVPDNEVQSMGEVIVKVMEGGGSDEVTVMDGLLYPHDPTYDDTVCPDMRSVKVALYDVMMDRHQRGELWEEGGLELEYDREAERAWGCVDITQCVQGLGVGLVAAQKVVGWEPRQQLEKAGIQVISSQILKYYLNERYFPQGH